MPIDVEQIEPDVYVLHWIGRVTLQEVKESHATTLQMATEAGVTRYVHILTTGKMTGFPLSGIGLARVMHAHPQVFAVLIVDPPSLARRFAFLLTGRLGKAKLEIFETLDEARQRTTELLAD